MDLQAGRAGPTLGERAIYTFRPPCVNPKPAEGCEITGTSGATATRRDPGALIPQGYVRAGPSFISMCAMASSLPPDLLAILVCPESKQPLLLVPPGVDGPDEFLFCPASRLRYRIDDGIPVMLVEEAVRIDEPAARRLTERLGG